MHPQSSVASLGIFEPPRKLSGTSSSWENFWRLPTFFGEKLGIFFFFFTFHVKFTFSHGKTGSVSNWISVLKTKIKYRNRKYEWSFLWSCSSFTTLQLTHVAVSSGIALDYPHSNFDTLRAADFLVILDTHTSFFC